jgi:vacuolar protein sorting-associated protein 13A/C
MCYAWDYPAAPDRALVLDIEGHQRAINLEEIGTLPPMSVSDNKSVGFDIWASDDGTSQHLDIKFYVESSLSLYRSRTNAGSTPNLKRLREESVFVVNPKAVSDRVRTSIRVLLKEGLGVSLINSTRAMELAYLTLQDIRLEVKETDTEYASSLQVRWIQIDNQLIGGFYPIILYPTVVPKTEKELADHPIFSASGTLLKDSEHGVTRFKFLQVLLQEMTAEADEDFLWSTLDTMQSVIKSFQDDDENRDYRLSDSPVLDVDNLVEASGGNLYFEWFLLNPVQLNLSFTRTETLNCEPTLLKEYPHRLPSDIGGTCHRGILSG